MTAPDQNSGLRWFLIVSVVAAAILLLMIVRDNTTDDDAKDAVTSAVDGRRQELDPTMSEAEHAEATKPPGQPDLPPDAADPQYKSPEERRYSSAKPLYFRMVFGENGTDSTLGVFDESGGTGSGYDVVYVDENRNGSLADDGVKKLDRHERGTRAGQIKPRFTVNGPFKDRLSAKYTIDFYSLARVTSIRATGYSFHWGLAVGPSNYFFINGRTTLFSSAAEALAAEPIRLGGRCKWDIRSARKSGKAVISAGLKDENGCTLRIAWLAGRMLAPKLSLIKDGKVELEEGMKFG